MNGVKPFIQREAKTNGEYFIIRWIITSITVYIFRKIDNVPKYLKNFGNYKLFIIYLIAIRFTTLFKKYNKIL